MYFSVDSKHHGMKSRYQLRTSLLESGIASVPFFRLLLIFSQISGMQSLGFSQRQQLQSIPQQSLFSPLYTIFHRNPQVFTIFLLPFLMRYGQLFQLSAPPFTTQFQVYGMRLTALFFHFQKRLNIFLITTNHLKQ